jgi:hypothetical protein
MDQIPKFKPKLNRYQFSFLLAIDFPMQSEFLFFIFINGVYDLHWIWSKMLEHGGGKELTRILSRGGNRSGRPTGAYGLAYLKPNSAQLFY